MGGNTFKQAYQSSEKWQWKYFAKQQLSSLGLVLNEFMRPREHWGGYPRLFSGTERCDKKQVGTLLMMAGWRGGEKLWPQCSENGLIGPDWWTVGDTDVLTEANWWVGTKHKSSAKLGSKCNTLDRPVADWQWRKLTNGEKMTLSFTSVGSAVSKGVIEVISVISRHHYHHNRHQHQGLSFTSVGSTMSRGSLRPRSLKRSFRLTGTTWHCITISKKLHNNVRSERIT